MKKTIIFYFMYLLVSQGWSQVKVSSQQLNEFKKISKEKVYLSYNNNFLITGEKLLFKIYVLNTTTNAYSNLSKMAYVKLLNKEHKVVLERKIRIDKGIGYGDFFIGTDIHSGGYKLIAYTKLMKNYNSFFYDDIMVVNPFADKKNINKIANKVALKLVESDKIRLKKVSYPQRSKVVFQLDSLINTENLSISIRKKTLLEVKKKHINLKLNENNDELAKGNVFIPDFRGELFSGYITSPDNLESSLEGVAIGVSILGKEGLFKIIKTNVKGEFYFNMNNYYSKDKVFVKILNNNKNYKIQMHKHNDLDYSELIFRDLVLNSDMVDLINKKSIYNQIENAYSKKDSVLNTYNTFSFSINQDKAKEFVLDDYKRFKSLKETMVEIVGDAWIKEENAKHWFYVRSIGVDVNNLKSLVVIDNYIVSNHDEVIKYDARKIEKITVVRGFQKINGEIYNGAVFIKSLKNDFKPDFSMNNMIAFKIVKPQDSKSYYFPNYSNDKNSRIPDFRTQLYWDPNFTGNSLIEFYTSDVTGDFLIEVEGVNSDGIPISLVKSFKVE